MKIRYLILCVSLFANCCQVDAQIFKLFELFSKSANKKSLAQEVERLSANSIKPKTELEAYNFIKSNSVIISDKNAIRLSEVNVFEYRNGIYNHGKDFNEYSKSDVIVFTSSTEKENFLYLSDRDLFNISATNPLAEFEAAKAFLKSKYGVTQFNVKNQKFINSVNDVLARDVLARNKLIDLKEKNGNIIYAIMEFQKTCELPITGNLDSKTINAFKKLTKKGIKNEQINDLYTSGNARIYLDHSYAGNFGTRLFKDKILQSKYLEPRFSILQKGKPDYSWKIPYLKFMANRKLIPADKELWTNLEVEKGFFKFQKSKSLRLSGELDQATLVALKEDMNGLNDKVFAINSDKTFMYKNKVYQKFTDIPFQSSDKLSFSRALSSEEAGYLMERGVKFVYNNPAYLKQRNKSFKIIYLISEEPTTVGKLYDLDEAHAKKLIELSSGLFKNKSITKASSFDEMIIKQNEIIKNNEVPVLIFHNNLDKTKLNIFNAECNFITCNSFNIKPDAYLTSTDFLDMQAIVQGITASSQNKTLQGFYSDFTTNYYSYMKQRHQQTTLIYLGGAVAVGGGVYSIVFYNSKK